MQDEPITDFDYVPPEQQLSIVDVLRQFAARCRAAAAYEQARTTNPNYEYRRIHICSREVAEIMLDPATPISTRMLLERATFAGYQWVEKDATA